MSKIQRATTTSGAVVEVKTDDEGEIFLRRVSGGPIVETSPLAGKYLQSWRHVRLMNKVQVGESIRVVFWDSEIYRSTPVVSIETTEGEHE